MFNLIGTAEAAERLGVSRQRVNAFIKSGRLHALRLPSGDYLLTTGDVEAFAEMSRPVGRPRVKDGVLVASIAERINTKT